MSAAQDIPALLAAALATSKMMASGQYDADFPRAPSDQTIAELAVLSQEPALAEELVRVLFGNTSPADVTFYDPLVHFYHHLRFGDPAKEILGIMWSQAFKRFNTGQIESVLMALTLLGQPFGLLLEVLPHLVKRQDLSAATLMRVSERIAKRIEDKFGPGLDRTLEAFTERQPGEALKVLSEVKPNDTNFWMLSILLGRLRIGPFAVENPSSFSQLENRFKESSEFVDRHVFYRSWFQEAFSKRIEVGQIDDLCAYADSQGKGDVHAMIYVLARWISFPLLSPTAFRRAFEWLEKRVSSDSSPGGKSQVAQFAAFFKESQYEWPDAWRPVIHPLVIAILPIAEEHAGIWDHFDFYLTSLLPTKADTFQMVVRAIADRSGETWLRVLKKGKVMDQFIDQMRGAGQDALIGDLCLSSDRIHRHLGLFFFDKLRATELPPAALAACDPRICWLLLFETAARHLTKGSAARCLLSLLTQVERLGEDFTNALKDELLLQAENYPRACGEFFTQKAGSNPIIQEVMGDQDRYFKALAETKNSPVLQMQVQGYLRALEEFFRNFSNQIQEGARKHSVLLQMTHEVAILYGLSWSTFQGNQLGAATDLQRISTPGSELPRLEFIDPEGMQARHLHALNQINALEVLLKEDS